MLTLNRPLEMLQSARLFATSNMHRSAGCWNECPVWIAAAKQDIFEADLALVRSGRVSGLFARRTRPLALMVSANQVPNRSADNKMSLTFDGVSRLTG